MEPGGKPEARGSFFTADHTDGADKSKAREARADLFVAFIVFPFQDSVSGVSRAGFHPWNPCNPWSLLPGDFFTADHADGTDTSTALKTMPALPHGLLSGFRLPLSGQ
jgi:hypothetical protein